MLKLEERENQSGASTDIGISPGTDSRLMISRRQVLALSISAGLFVVGAAAATYFAIQKSSRAEKAAATTSPPPVVTVTTQQPLVQMIDDTISLTGSVSAWDPLSIGAEVNGLQITQVSVEEGDYVKKGQILAVLNSSVLEAQLKQAQARLSSAEANLRKAIQPNRPEEIQALRAALAEAEAKTAQDQAHVKEARVNYENALLNAKRYARLANVGAVSYQDAENKQVAADTAHEQLLSA